MYAFAFFGPTIYVASNICVFSFFGFTDFDFLISFSFFSVCFSDYSFFALLLFVFTLFVIEESSLRMSSIGQ
jgi:hypothetical protein